MKIERFNEAYKYGYRGKGLKANRKEVIQEFIDIFQDADFLGYEIVGTVYYPNEETLYLPLDRKVKDSYSNEGYCAKLDLSGMGIELGKMKWNENKEEYDPFIPESNLDSENVKTVRNIKKYNI